MTTQKTFLAALGLAALFGSNLALADHDHGPKHGGPRKEIIALEQSKISATQAIAIAEKDTGATADNLELELHRALTRTAAGRATLIVAHRRSTVERADRVIVLEDGRIIADTTPDWLAASGTWWNAPPGQAQQACPGEDEMLGGGEPWRSR